MTLAVDEERAADDEAHLPIDRSVKQLAIVNAVIGIARSLRVRVIGRRPIRAAPQKMPESRR